MKNRLIQINSLVARLSLLIFQKKYWTFVFGVGFSFLVAWRIDLYVDAQKKKSEVSAKAIVPETPTEANTDNAQSYDQQSASYETEKVEMPIIDLPEPPPVEIASKPFSTISVLAVALILAVFGIALFIIIRHWRSKILIAKQLETETDPEELQLLFKEYKESISKLGTPRNIKRFFNKARVQYNLLEKGEGFNKEQLSLSFQLLLCIEENRTEFAGLKSIEQYPDSFYVTFLGFQEKAKLLKKSFNDAGEKIIPPLQYSNPDQDSKKLFGTFFNVDKNKIVHERMYSLNKDVIT